MHVTALKLASVAFCVFAPLAIAKDLPATAQGQLSVAGQTIELIDVIALPGTFGTEVLAYAQRFDRAKLAEDGKLDSNDVFRLQFEDGPALVRFSVGADKQVSLCIDVRGKDLKTKLCDAIKLDLSTLSESRIAGVLSGTSQGDKIRLSFDAPIQSTLEPVVVGTPLPSDGGEPGKALALHFAAMQSGDLSKVLALAPPEQKAAMEKQNPEQIQKMLGLMKTMTPSDVQITGGRIDGDKAWVDFRGKKSGQAVTGTADMARSAGQWRVSKISTQQ